MYLEYHVENKMQRQQKKGRKKEKRKEDVCKFINKIGLLGLKYSNRKHF